MGSQQLSEALRRAAVRATRAPSIHNTQPWRLFIGQDWLEIYSDPDRRLHVLDPRARQLTLSCGCALLNARAALAASGLGVIVERFPDPARPLLAARITVDGSVPADTELATLEPAIDTRQTNRRAFTDKAVPGDFVTLLVEAALTEGAELKPVDSLKERNAVARLNRLAERQEILDPAYRAELAAWTTDDPNRRDGVAASVTPRGDYVIGNDLIRDFDTHGSGELPSSRSSLAERLFVLGAPEGDAPAWLRAGEALERVQLLVELHGYASSPLTQVIEVAQTNAMLSSELQLRTFPQVVLRVGRAPRTPETRRRRLVDVITDTT